MANGRPSAGARDQAPRAATDALEWMAAMTGLRLPLLTLGLSSTIWSWCSFLTGKALDGGVRVSLWVHLPPRKQLDPWSWALVTGLPLRPSAICPRV